MYSIYCWETGSKLEEFSCYSAAQRWLMEHPERFKLMIIKGE